LLKRRKNLLINRVQPSSGAVLTDGVAVVSKISWRRGVLLGLIDWYGWRGLQL